MRRRHPGLTTTVRGENPPRRRGYVLIFVLALTATVAALGWAFLDSHDTILPEAQNRLGALRAQYLAESGIALGMHFLMYPPTTVACGNHWTGGSNIAIDATTDYTTVSVTQDSTDPNLFTIKAAGFAHDFDGVTVLGRRSITAEVIRPSDGKYRIPYAYLGLSDTWLPGTLAVNGDLHVNGQLAAFSWCRGTVSASDYIWWYGGGPPVAVNPYTRPFYAVPSGGVAQYANYTINGVKYTAYAYGKTSMSKSDADTLNALNMSATNPGRIIVTPSGSFQLNKDAALNGTLVVRGDLYVDNTGTRITAQPDYPALVVFGRIFYNRHNAALDCNGSLICTGGVYDQGLVANLSVTGAMILGWGFNSVGSGDDYRATYDCAKATFWNFNRSAERLPITVLSWTEN